ncbi:MAG: hypothetical protein M1836_001013 [Candelina mexicana]|nr:MAG: hypothetical protein M1836_001013 [Candelina mexicana]
MSLPQPTPHVARAKKTNLNGFTSTMAPAATPARHTQTMNASYPHLQALMTALVASLVLLTLLSTLMVFRIMTRLGAITHKLTKVKTSETAVQTDKEEIGQTTLSDKTEEDEEKENRSPTDLFLDFADGLFELTSSEGVETPVEPGFLSFEGLDSPVGEESEDILDLPPLSPLFDSENLSSFPSLQRVTKHVPVLEHVDNAKYQGLANDYILCDIAEHDGATSESPVDAAFEEEVTRRPNQLSIPEPNDTRCDTQCGSPPPSAFELVVTPPTPTAIDSPRPSAFELTVTPPPGTKVPLPTPTLEFVVTPPTSTETQSAVTEAPSFDTLDHLTVPSFPDSEPGRVKVIDESNDLDDTVANLSCALDAFFQTGEELMTREDFERFERILAGIEDNDDESDNDSTPEEIEECSRNLLTVIDESGLGSELHPERPPSTHGDQAPWANGDDVEFSIEECPSVSNVDCDDVIEDLPETHEGTEQEAEDRLVTDLEAFFCSLLRNALVNQPTEIVLHDEAEERLVADLEAVFCSLLRRALVDQSTEIELHDEDTPTDLDPTISHSFLDTLYQEDECPISLDEETANCAYRTTQACSLFTALPFQNLDDLPSIVAPSCVVVKQLDNDVDSDKGVPLFDTPKETLREKNLGRRSWKQEVLAQEEEAAREPSDSECEVICDNEELDQDSQTASEIVIAPLTTANLERHHASEKLGPFTCKSPESTNQQTQYPYEVVPASPSNDSYEYRYFFDKDMTSSPTMLSYSSSKSEESQYEQDAQAIFDKMCDTDDSSPTMLSHSPIISNEVDAHWRQYKQDVHAASDKKCDTNNSEERVDIAQRLRELEELRDSIMARRIFFSRVRVYAEQTGQRFEDARQAVFNDSSLLELDRSLLGGQRTRDEPAEEQQSDSSSCRSSSDSESEHSSEPDSDAPAGEWFSWARRQSGMSWGRVIAGLKHRSFDEDTPRIIDYDSEAVATDSESGDGDIYDSDSDESYLGSDESVSTSSSASNSSNAVEVSPTDYVYLDSNFEELHHFIPPQPENGLLSEANLAYYEAHIQRLRSRAGLTTTAQQQPGDEELDWETCSSTTTTTSSAHGSWEDADSEYTEWQGSDSSSAGDSDDFAPPPGFGEEESRRRRLRDISRGG